MKKKVVIYYIVSFAPTNFNFYMQNNLLFFGLMLLGSWQTSSFDRRWQGVDTGTDLTECRHATKISGPTSFFRTFGLPTS